MAGEIGDLFSQSARALDLIICFLINEGEFGLLGTRLRCNIFVLGKLGLAADDIAALAGRGIINARGSQ